LSVSGWREIAEYGVYDSLRRLLYFAWDSLPLLAFGKTLGAGGLGLYQRALTIAKLPEKTVLTGLAPVLLPAYAQQAREGGNLTTALLRSIEYVTAIFWPAMILIAILAKPIVDVLLGSQWIAAVPIIQLIAVALLLQLPASIANSIQIAAGGVRDSFILALIIVPITIVIQVYASTYGLTAAAASLFITCPLGLIASLVVLRWRIPFTRQELLGAVRSSAIVAFFTALAPAIIAILSGGTQKISIMGAAIALVLAGIGWLVGLRIARHPLLDEIGRVRDALVTRLSGRA
jgi:O-antigen/teichoic acid export membrane protein